MISIKLGEKLEGGGEGVVYTVEGRPDIVYKQYKPFKVTPAVQNKLNYMLSLNFNTNMNQHFSWPIEVVGNSSGKLDGFTMNKLKIDIKLNDVYSNKGKAYPYEFAVVVGINLCTMVNQIHQQKFEIVIGDFNHDNVGVDTDNSFVSMMDIDSFHLGKRYPCVVCMPGYAAPELLKYMDEVNVSRFDDPLLLRSFTKETDLFSLAVHLFRLLMNGVSPYNGINTKIHKSSDVVEAGNKPVKEGHYVFRPGLEPAHPACPPKYVLTDELLALFDRAFVDVKNGRDQPRRPKALEWHRALENYRRVLKRCANDKTHQYYSALTCCPWCEAERRDKMVLSKISSKLLPPYTVRRR